MYDIVQVAERRFLITRRWPYATTASVMATTLSLVHAELIRDALRAYDAPPPAPTPAGRPRLLRQDESPPRCP